MKVLIKRLLVALALLALPALAQIEKVEPPHWWAGMSDPNLELMIYGKGVSQSRVSIARGKATLVGTTPGSNPDILFVQLRLPPSEKSQILSLTLSGTEDHPFSYTLDYPLKARQPDSKNRQGFGEGDVIYLITPDRFANGDPANDAVAGFTDTVNRTQKDSRHGGDLSGIIARLDYLKRMGFTQLWLNPIVENNMPRASYHGYAATNLYRIDSRFGSHQHYLELVREASARGIGVIQDMVPNHIGSQHPWLAAPPMDDWFNYQGRFHPTNHMRETIQDPYANKEDLREFTDGWFVKTMPDLNQRNPHLANYLIQNAIWWIEEAGLSGLRIDTWPYSDKQFLQDWSRRILAEYPNLNMVGEEWSLNPNTIAYWQAGKKNADGYTNQLPSLFDFPLQDALASALKEPESWNSGWVKLYRTLAMDGVYTNARGLTIFADNHDMSRIHTQLDHDPALTRMAIALVATLRGIPQFFYGTEVLMANPKSDSHDDIRGEFPGGWADHQADAVSGTGLNKEQQITQAWMQQLLHWRARTPAIYRGDFHHLAPRDGIYAFSRQWQNQRIVVIANKNSEAKPLSPRIRSQLLSRCERAQDALKPERTLDLARLTLAPQSITLIQINPTSCH